MKKKVSGYYLFHMLIFGQIYLFMKLLFIKEVSNMNKLFIEHSHERIILLLL